MDGLLKKTIEHFQAALGALKNAQELQPGDIDLEVELARVTTELGNYLAETGEDDDLAIEFLQEGVALAEEIVRYSDDSPVALYAAATCHFATALVLKQRDRVSEAIVDFEAAQGHLARLNQLSRGPGTLDEFFVVRHLAECLISEARHQDALVQLREVWANLETLSQKPGTVVPLSDLALSLLPIVAEATGELVDPDEIAFLTKLLGALDKVADPARQNQADRAVILKAVLPRLISKATNAPDIRSRLASMLGRELAIRTPKT
jgi:tetratricopeptide (TPR) repeat protein